MHRPKLPGGGPGPRLLLLPLAAALSACPPPIDTGADGGMIFVGPEGGIFVREGAVIEIPKGALDAEAQISVTPMDEGIPEVPGRKRVSLGYRFSPSGIVFNEPVKLALPYLEERVPPGVEPDTFDMRRRSGEDPYLQLPGGAAHADVKAFEARTDRLGLFWVTSPEQAAVSKLTLEPTEITLRVGEKQKFTATVTDPAGNPLPVPVTWSVVAPRIATVDQDGLLTATGPGRATLTASAGPQSATAEVRVVGDTEGPKTFLHDNPFPTGNDLHGGVIAQGTAFFVGGNATVLSVSPTDDWSRHFSEPGVTLKAIAGTSPSNAVAVGVAGTSGVLVEVTGTTAKATPFPTVEPRALWFDGTHGMAVGYGNDVLVRRSGAWVTEYSPSVETLLSVIGDGQGGFTTVGSRGSLYRFDPVTQTWNSLYQTQLSVLLTAATLVSPTGEAWAVGGNKLWRFDGGAWTAINLPSSPTLDELTAVAEVDGKVVIGGRELKSGHLLIFDPAGATWTVSPLRGPQIIRGIFSEGAVGYAVGDYGAVWKYSGGTFTEVSHGFYGNVVDVAVAGDVVVAAVNECTNAACTNRKGKVMLRTAPFTWVELGGSAQPFTGPLLSITARSATDVVVGDHAAMFYWDGTGWWPVAVSGGTGGPFNDVQFCGTSLWATGGSAVMYRGTNSQSVKAFQTLGNKPLQAVHCASDSQIWAVGEESLWEKNGADKFLARVSNKVQHAAWYGVWSPGTGEAWAFGDSRYGVYWNTRDLVAIMAPGGILPEILTGVWGSSVDNLYTVGYTVTPLAFGYGVRFDGANWSVIDAGSQRKVNAISGSSATNVWLGSDGGGVLRGIMP